MKTASAWIAAFTLSACLLAPRASFAVARAGHQHEDLFGEEDLLMGFKLGPQINGYTSIQVPGAIVSVQSSMRFLAGWAVKFIYPWPRFEIDFFWNARGGINNADTLHSLATPVLVKLPWEVDRGKIDVEFGLGVQPESVLFGFDPHSLFLMGLVGSLGVQVDFKTFIYEFELRYNVGLDSIAETINGARPRDFQLINGFLWHF